MDCEVCRERRLKDFVRFRVFGFVAALLGRETEASEFIISHLGVSLDRIHVGTEVYTGSSPKGCDLLYSCYNLNQNTKLGYEGIRKDTTTRRRHCQRSVVLERDE